MRGRCLEGYFVFDTGDRLGVLGDLPGDLPGDLLGDLLGDLHGDTW